MVGGRGVKESITGSPNTDRTLKSKLTNLKQRGLAVLEFATLVVGPGQVHHHLHVVVLEELLQGIFILKHNTLSLKNIICIYSHTETSHTHTRTPPKELQDFSILKHDTSIQFSLN